MSEHLHHLRGYVDYRDYRQIQEHVGHQTNPDRKKFLIQQTKGGFQTLFDLLVRNCSNN